MSATTEPTTGASMDSIVRELKDRVDVLETMYAYCRHADMLDGNAMADLFIPDCASNFFAGRPEHELRGREPLRAFLRGALKTTLSGSHHIANPELIFETPDRVTLHCYMYSWQRFEGHPSTADCHRWGRYENQFVRTGEGWRLSRLRLVSAGEYGGARFAEQLGRAFPPSFD